ncbi:MAG TPA: DEAD/DEAH box helicase [Candidatus Paceibacterota bacterium]|nr:DEAD/DEAH box helicase [Candidatus Paceibacterota bacterium]
MHNAHRQGRSSSSRFARQGGRGRNTFHASGRRSGGRQTNHRGGGGRGHGGGRRRVQPTFDVSKFINTNPVVREPETFSPKHSFADFGLDRRITAAIAKAGLTHPTPIQDEIIPHIMAGKDVIGLANTGTGKTAAFLIPLIEAVLKDGRREVLVLTPTRELAIQIEAEFKRLAEGTPLRSTICVGGTNIRPQISGLKRKNHFVIGTPGRIIDLIERRAFRPEGMSTVVLDEADRMLDMGFIGDMRMIVGRIPASRETLFFSATMSDDIKKLVHEFLKDPVTVSVRKQDITSSVRQDVVRYQHASKFETLTKLLADPSMKRVLVFGAMKHSVEKLSKELARAGIAAASIHGNKTHGQRQRALQSFKSGQSRVLVATDVAARGIHVDRVSHVINYDLPATYEDYVHRIGRTGRGKEEGMALTFVEG